MKKLFIAAAMLLVLLACEKENVNQLNQKKMTLPSTNITTTMVRNVIGENTNDVGLLCSSIRINKWSLYKPHKWQTPRSGAITDALAWRVTNVSTVKTTKEINDNSNYLNSVHYHLGDFRNYNHAEDSKYHDGIRITSSNLSASKPSERDTLWDVKIPFKTRLLSASWFNKVTGKKLKKRYVYAYYDQTQSSSTIHKIKELSGSEGAEISSSIKLYIFGADRTQFLPVYIQDVYEDTEGTFYSLSCGKAQATVNDWTISYGRAYIYWQYDKSKYNNATTNTDLNALTLKTENCTVVLGKKGIALGGSLQLFSHYRGFTIGSSRFGFHLVRRKTGTNKWYGTGNYKRITNYLNWGSSSQGSINCSSVSFVFTPLDGWDYALELTCPNVSKDAGRWDMKAAPNPNYYGYQSIRM